MPVEPGEMTAAPAEPADLPEDELTANDPLIAPVADQTASILPEGVDWQEDDDPLPSKFSNEEDEILFGDPEGLGLDRPSAEVASKTVPASVIRRLPALTRYARNPSAPPALRAMQKLLADRLERELRG